MNADTLERLMMDRALGELPADAEELLEAYLQDRPAERQASERIVRTVRGAKRAMSVEPEVKLGPFPVRTIERHLNAQRRWALAGRITSLAACVLIGVGVHATWTTQARVSQNPSHSPEFAERTPSALLAQVQRPPDDGGFWSVKRAYERAGQRRPEPGRRVIWDSPLSTPRLGDAT